MIKEKRRETANNNDLLVFVAYFDDLQAFTGYSKYKILKGANLPLTYYKDVIRYLTGRTTYRKHFNIGLFIHLSLLYSFPFDLSKYMHLLEPLRKIETLEDK